MTDENLPTPESATEPTATAPEPTESAPEPTATAPEPPAAAAPPVAPPVAPQVAQPAPPPGAEYAPPQWPSAAPAGDAASQPVYASAPLPVYQVAAPTSSNAVVALILAVASWAVCPIVAAVVALVFASTAAKEIEASGGRVQGGGLVTAAKIVAWVNIGLFAAGIVIFAFVFILIAVAGGMSSTVGLTAGRVRNGSAGHPVLTRQRGAKANLAPCA